MRHEAREGVVDRRRVRVAARAASSPDAATPPSRDVGEDEGERLLGSGLEPQVELVRADRVPAVRDARLRRAGERHGSLVQPVVHADEGIARGVEARDLARAAEERVVVAALAVLCRVEDRRAFDLDLADRVRALEVRHVVQRLVEAELDEGEERQLLALARLCCGPSSARARRSRPAARRRAARPRRRPSRRRCACSRARAGTRSGRGGVFVGFQPGFQTLSPSRT